MDLERAGDQLVRLIEKRARQRETANREVATWKEPARRRRERMRRDNALAWCAHYESMARAHHDLAAEAAAKADALREHLQERSEA